ncbi:DUF6958 family protein [Novipirellula rosea]|uniref:Lipoprotein n=1 Tax=Novipirellula rosea TaxID=1031540 RepID=A0ABP8MI89_9BACT
MAVPTKQKLLDIANFASLKRASLVLMMLIAATGCSSQPMEIKPKMECRSPNGLRDNKKMFQWKYDRVREVILEVLPEGEEGMPFPELRDIAEQQFKSSEREEIGKLSWFVETVTLEMETRGELQRFPETKTPTPLPKNVRRVPNAI